jgi:hypothetical protein
VIAIKGTDIVSKSLKHEKWTKKWRRERIFCREVDPLQRSKLMKDIPVMFHHMAVQEALLDLGLPVISSKV